MLLLGKIHNSGMNETLDTLVAQKWNVSRRNLPRCLFQPLHSPFLSVFSPLKGLILCTQTSRVEGHHQVTPTRPTTHCHFAVLPETLALSTLETWLLNFSEPSSTPDPPDILAKILIYNETVGLLRDICATREIVLQWNFHWNFYRFFLVFGFWFLVFFFFGFAKRSTCSLNNYYVKFVTWRISCKFFFRSCMCCCWCCWKVVGIIPDSEISSTVPCYSRHD